MVTNVCYLGNIYGPESEDAGSTKERNTWLAEKVVDGLKQARQMDCFEPIGTDTLKRMGDLAGIPMSAES